MTPAGTNGEPQGTSESQGAKATKEGTKLEQIVDDVLVNLGYKRPGKISLRATRLSGKGQRLDNACWLDDLHEAVEPVRSRRGDLVNVVISVKRQGSAGTTDQKIATELDDLAHYSDETGIPAVLVLDAPVFVPCQLAELRARADDAAVGLITLAELCAGHLPRAALRAALHRSRLPVETDSSHAQEIRRIEASLTAAEIGWMKRHKIRKAVFGPGH